MGAIKTILVLVLILVAIFFGFKMFTPEDSWICQDGEWKQHGKPSTPMPTSPCDSAI